MNSAIFLMEMGKDATALENCLAVSYKSKNSSTLGLRALLLRTTKEK